MQVKPKLKFDHPTFLFFGRPGVSKGINYLFDAVPKIIEEVPNAKLIMMISFDRERWLNEAKKRGIDSYIEMLPSQPTAADVARVIKSVDVVCMPSITEGFGFNAAEAQACGVPVVASNATSLPEVVRGGILVPPRNGDAIAKAVINLLNKPSERKRLGDLGNKYVQRFTWENSVSQHIKLYEKMLG